jgi:hypothetical protein
MMQRLTEILICLIALWKNKPVQAISLKIFMHWLMELGFECCGIILGSGVWGQTSGLGHLAF